MATPMTANQRLAAYRRWGVPVRERAGWETHDRTGPGRPWGPVHGVMIHHTGDDAPDLADERVLWAGRSDLPGPLCHDGQRDDGVAVLMSAGRANHAGPGSSRVLDAMREDRRPPPPGPDDTDGNRHFYGRETMYSGKNPPTGPAYRSSVLACAAICEFHGWNPHTSVIGHREWTRRKPDPGSLDMDAFRSDVAEALRLGPPAARPPAPKPPAPSNPTVTPQGGDMLYQIGDRVYVAGGDRLLVGERECQKLYRVAGGDADDADGGYHDYVDAGVPVVKASLERLRAIGYAVQGSDF